MTLVRLSVTRLCEQSSSTLIESGSRSITERTKRRSYIRGKSTGYDVEDGHRWSILSKMNFA